MHTVFTLLGLISGVTFLACLVWLPWRAYRDGAIQDVFLFLTGVSILSYILCRWGRAKSPTLGIFGSAVVLGIVIGVSGSYDAPSHEPSREEVAAEVKPLILEEWKKSPEFREATIQSISLAATGRGVTPGLSRWGLADSLSALRLKLRSTAKPLAGSSSLWQDEVNRSRPRRCTGPGHVICFSVLPARLCRRLVSHTLRPVSGTFGHTIPNSSGILDG